MKCAANHTMAVKTKSIARISASKKHIGMVNVKTSEIINKALWDAHLTAKDLSIKTGFHYNTILRWTNAECEPNLFNLRTCLEVCGYEIQIVKINKE